MAAQEDSTPNDPPRQSPWLWPIVGLALLVAAVAYVTTFDFLQLGDGAVGVDSDSLRLATSEALPGETGTAFVLRDPAGSMTIGFPVSNRGFVPVTMLEIQPAPAADAEPQGACDWRRVAVRDRREGVAPAAGATNPFGTVRLPPGRNLQLFVEAGFPEGECSSPLEAHRTVEDLVVQYEVFGLIPRRQEIPLTVKVTTVLDPDDPALGSGQD